MEQSLFANIRLIVVARIIVSEVGGDVLPKVILGKKWAWSAWNLP